VQFRKHVLDNGLEIVAECNPNAYSMAAGFFVRAGARDETDANSGVSHFLEHMAFKGTARRSAADINRQLDEIGSDSNAYTSEEQTVYYVAVVPEYQDDAVDLLSDMMRPALRKDDFETEKKVILEEIQKYDDQPPFGAHEKGMAAYFEGHALGRTVLGTHESVSALTPDAMMAYFESRYSPSNMTLVATGKVDFDRLVELTARQCSAWRPHTVERKICPAVGNAKTIVLKKESAKQQYLIQISAAPASLDPDRYAQRLMSVILGDDAGSRMYWEFVDSGRAEYAVCGTHEFDGAGITMCYLCCDPDDMGDNIRRLDQLAEKLEAEGVSEDELELAKSKTCSHIVRRAERPGSRLFHVGSNWLKRHEYVTVKSAVDSYMGVTVEQIHATLRRFPLTAHTSVFAGPLSSAPR
jgi:predicted Zn-dependent peptidase